MHDLTESGSLLEFPCRFPIKVMGRQESRFREIALGIIERHTGSIDGGDIRVVPSNAGNFVSITVTIDAVSQMQLDAIYGDLSANEDILVAL
jgi:hypothetical protein